MPSIFISYIVHQKFTSKLESWGKAKHSLTSFLDTKNLVTYLCTVYISEINIRIIPFENHAIVWNLKKIILLDFWTNGWSSSLTSSVCTRRETLQLVDVRVIFDRVRNRKNYFWIIYCCFEFWTRNFKSGKFKWKHKKHKKTHLSCWKV